MKDNALNAPKELEDVVKVNFPHISFRYTFSGNILTDIVADKALLRNRSPPSASWGRSFGTPPFG